MVRGTIRQRGDQCRSDPVRQWRDVRGAVGTRDGDGSDDIGVRSHKHTSVRLKDGHQLS